MCNCSLFRALQAICYEHLNTLFEVMGLAPLSPEDAVPTLAVPGATAVARRI